MKVAVISAAPTCGKSCFIHVLATVYSRSQQRDVVILSTGDATENLDLASNVVKTSGLDNPHIVKAMVDEVGPDIDSVLDYGIRIGTERAFVFDILNCAMAKEDKQDFLVNALKNIPASLTLVEVCGDIRSELNKRVLEECDCSIVLVDCSQLGIKRLKQLMQNMPDCPVKMNRAVVINRYDQAVCSMKKFSEMAKIAQFDLFKFYYNVQIPKLAMTGQLDKIAYNIVNGDFEVANLRMCLQEIMSFIFDSPAKKIIRSIDRWYK